MREPSIPKEVHGICAVCGPGRDYPASQLTSADAQTNLSTDPVEQDLFWYDGILMCALCKQNKINRDESDTVADRLADEQTFRDNAGFKRTIS